MDAPQLSQVPQQRLQQIPLLAPQLRQALEVLQAPLPELRALIRREMESNPVLEEKGEAQESLEASSAESAPPPEDRELEFRETYEALSRLDEEWRDYFEQAEAWRESTTEAEKRHQWLIDSLTRDRQTLQEFLVEQVGFLDLSPSDRALALTIIGSLDDDGYLNVTLGELSETTGIPLERLEALLAKIQELDPPGVGARDLRECLQLQLRRIGKAEGLEAVLVREFLELLGRHKYEEIARALHVPVEQVAQAAAVVAGLEPKPGRNFGGERVGYVVPELEVVREGEAYQVRLKRDRLPRLRISRQYRQMFEDPNTPEETRAYLREKIQSALLLARNIDQRNQTLLNVAKEIVRRQHRFFEEGVSGLEPLTMAEVARTLGLHETTVSRAVNGKYVETPRGVFELRSFFTGGFRTADGRTISNEAVKDLIARWIHEEDPSKPFSDQDLADRLAKEGLPVARRTVAKYREELRIPPSHLRRR